MNGDAVFVGLNGLGKGCAFKEGDVPFRILVATQFHGIVDQAGVQHLQGLVEMTGLRFRHQGLHFRIDLFERPGVFVGL